MIVAKLIRAAQTKVVINSVIIWNPYTSRTLYVGKANEVPKPLQNKEVHAYRYDKDRQRMIIRVQA